MFFVWFHAAKILNNCQKWLWFTLAMLDLSMLYMFGWLYPRCLLSDQTPVVCTRITIKRIASRDKFKLCLFDDRCCVSVFFLYVKVWCFWFVFVDKDSRVDYFEWRLNHNCVYSVNPCDDILFSSEVLYLGYKTDWFDFW